MTTIDSPLADIGHSLDTRPAADRARNERRLRLVLRANAISSASFGLIGAAGARFWSDRLGIDHVAITAVVAISLILFAADVWWVSTRPLPSLRSSVLAVSGADFVWVVASLVVIALGLLTTTGVVAALIVALLVADFGAVQLLLRNRLGRR